MSAIKQGNTGPLWRVGVNELDADGVPTGSLIDLSVAGWTCRLGVATASAPIDRAVTDLSSDNFRFLVQLTPAETDLLEPEKHVVAIELSNATLTPPFNLEEHVDLVVEEQRLT